MRLFLTADEAFPDVAFARQLVSDVAPTHVQIAAGATCLQEGIQGVPFEVVAPGNRAADLVMRFEDDPLVVAVQHSVLPTVVFRSTSGTWLERVDAPKRGSIDKDLAYVLSVLRGLYKVAGAPQDEIKDAGKSTSRAAEKPTPEMLHVAWQDVEHLRKNHPRFAPWLITPDRVLCRWFFALEVRRAPPPKD